jgi:uncharacterized protein YkwD
MTGCLTPSNIETTPQVVVITPTFTPALTLTGVPTAEGPLQGESPTEAASATLEVVPSLTPSPETLPVVIATDIPATSTAIPVVSASVGGEVAAGEQYTIDLINLQRMAAGVPSLARDETLMGVARGRVADMVARGYTGHTDPVTGEYLFRAMLQAAGYTTNWYGENWYGTMSAPPANAEVAMNWFMTDPPHANNILSPHYTAVGVGIAFNGQMWLLVQDFAGR